MEMVGIVFFFFFKKQFFFVFVLFHTGLLRKIFLKS